MVDIAQDLRAQVDALPPSHRQRFRRRLSGASNIADPDRRQKVLDLLAEEVSALNARMQRLRSLLPDPMEYPEELPITDRRSDLLEAIRDHQVVIVAGETGSGKSTQLPKLCLELGRGVAGLIGHTQPRRIAARSIAERIAEEVGTTVGGLVGYTVRFSDQVGDDTVVKVMTDGILLAEIHNDRRLNRYDTIILDEAHERSLNIDFLIGYLKGLLPKRPDLKLIITSATIDTERFSEHFNDAPVISVTGRTYPVEMRYRPLDDPGMPRDQPQGIADAVLELAAESTDDILVFCSGEREIRDAADAIDELELAHTEVLPLFARLSSAEQHRVFQPHTGRRVVVATNVAETSLTVPGIRSVVDAGTARISRYSRRTKVQRLPIEAISRASANQRAGRCGRLGPGVCIRLFAEDDFESRPEFTEPEIQRTNLASVILQMAALDLGDIESFPFLDPPDARTIRDGIALLEELGAVTAEHVGSPRWLTKLGRQLAAIPIDLRLARMIVEADGNACLREVLVIAAALSIQDPRERPRDHQEQADQLHARFRDTSSDFLSWLRLWEYVHEERRDRSSSQFRRMCRDEFLNYRRIREWQDIHSQLREVSRELGFVLGRPTTDTDMIHRSLLAGLLSQVGVKDPDSYEYRGARGARFAISPGSALFKRAPEWVMAAELVETTRLWARSVAPVTPTEIEQAAPHLIKRSYSDPWWEVDLGAAVVAETATLYGLPLVTDQVVQAGRIVPDAARELFIRHALVAGEWDTHHPFVAKNRDLIEDVLATERRERRNDLLASDDQLVAFFDQRIPENIVSVRDFDRWWRDERERDPSLLDLAWDDVIDPGATEPDEEGFPEIWRHGDLAMPLEYAFDPASEEDGVVVDVPLSGLNRVDPAIFDWHVPGMREELVTALIRSLPKRIRKTLLPIGETAKTVADRLAEGEGNLVQAVRREVTRISGVSVPPEALSLEDLAPHLRPSFRIIDDDGSVVAAGSDLALLKDQYLEAARDTVAATTHEIEATGITSWNFGELPTAVTVGEGSHRAEAYPALVDEGESVAIRLLATRHEQADAMWAGTRRLLLLTLASPGKILRPLLTNDARLALRSAPYETAGEWVDDCLAAALDETMSGAGGPAWNAVRFDELVAAARDELGDLAIDVGTASLELFATLHSVQEKLSRAQIGERWQPAVDDIHDQLDLLIYPGFLAGIGTGRIGDVHRYLKAVEWRIDRLPENHVKDAENMDRIRHLEQEHDRLTELLGPSTPLIEVAWMLQELRVSLFAQPLGTRGKVSEKRIAMSLAEALDPGE